MELSIEVEKPSSILRKMTVKVPAKEVKNRFDRGLVAVQKTANLKGFRPGQAPLAIIKQYYGEDVRHRLFHSLIDESFEKAVRDQKLRTIGSPKIDTPEHQTGAGDHDHALKEDQDLTFTATFEVMPEITVKDYTGLSLNQDKVDVQEEHLDKVVDNLHQSQAQLVPVGSGLVGADGADTSRPVQKGDFVDVQFTGGIVTESGVENRDELKGDRLIEVGANSWLPGFDEPLIGVKRGESKTFRVKMEKDFSLTELADQEIEFTAKVNEIKEKKLPVLDDELVKQMGYEGMEDLRTKARDYLQRERTEESDRKVRSELLAALIEKNPFDVPAALIEGQTRALAQEWAQELKKQGYDDKMIQAAIMQEMTGLKTRADSQVRASLVLESIAQQEGIKISEEAVNAEIVRLSQSMQVEEAKLQDYYAKNAGRRDDLEFRLRQEETLKFLLGKSKIKLVAAAK